MANNTRINYKILTTKTVEVTTLRDILSACYGDQTECSRLTGLNRATVYRHAKRGADDIYFIVTRGDSDIKFTKAA